MVATGDQPLKNSETLVLFDPPLSPQVLRRWLDESEAGRLVLLWPEGRSVPPSVQPETLNAVYRSLKTLTGRTTEAVFQTPWPQGPEIFAAVWQALREAGLVLQDGSVWRLLSPGGTKIETRELPAVKRHEAMRGYWQALAAAGADDLLPVLLGERL
jgi:hypothetical protein